MKLGVHAGQLADSLAAADQVLLFVPPDLAWNPAVVLAPLALRLGLFDTTEALIERVVAQAEPGDHLLVMSNGGFENIHQRLLEALQTNGGKDRA
jgi:UDP-N-acetylmuramate: L-alanyl-gamma-D-glutamyl-meso-diaminopimelate ligase